MATVQWIYCCFNAKYLFYPFCETRNNKEMLSFLNEERQDAMLTYIVDVYAKDLASATDAVSLKDALLAKSDYYSAARSDVNDNSFKDRQMDFFGSLRWEFEEFIPFKRQKTIALGYSEQRQNCI